MSSTVVSTAGAALNHLGINYRDFPCRSGELYFCTIPENGLTFDMQYDENGLIQLWRFVGTASGFKAGTRCEYRKADNSNATIGILVTDEGDICFYAEQIIDSKDPEGDTRMKRMIKRYTEMISKSSLCEYKL